MEELKLVELSLELESSFNDYLNEWRTANEKLVPSCLNKEYGSFTELVEKFSNYKKGIDIPDGYVPNSIYFLVDINNKILGCVQIRHRLNEFLYNFGGNIGYGIVPSKRGMGYGKKMLALALPIAKELGLSEALITCKKENKASRGVMKANGAEYINDMKDDNEGSATYGKIFERYKIIL